MKWGLLFLLITSSAFANDFVQSKMASQKIKCFAKKDTINFEGSKLSYKLYEKNLESLRLEDCEKVTIQGLPFYTVKYSSVLNTPSGKKKVFIYDVAIEKAKALQTVRSEVIDEQDASGLVPDTEFTRSMESKWGHSQKDKSVMLMVTMTEKNEKPFSYMLKMNAKKTWFENVF